MPRAQETTAAATRSRPNPTSTMAAVHSAASLPLPRRNPFRRRLESPPTGPIPGDPLLRSSAAPPTGKQWHSGGNLSSQPFPPLAAVCSGSGVRRGRPPSGWHGATDSRRREGNGRLWRSGHRAIGGWPRGDHVGSPARTARGAARTARRSARIAVAHGGCVWLVGRAAAPIATRATKRAAQHHQYSR
jgi:hypothetical protein